jgi:hypothetical protein
MPAWLLYALCACGSHGLTNFLTVDEYIVAARGDHFSKGCNFKEVPKGLKGN